MHVLILGGTRDAMTLAGELVDHPVIRPTYSLAGRTRRPLPPDLPTRRGGFGGIEGLRDWLVREQVAAVVDATHPFAAQMSRHALEACRGLGLPLASLTRRPWTPEADDHWIHVPDLDAAAGCLPRLTSPGARILLTTGRTRLAAFETVADRHFVVRCVDPPEPPPAFTSWTLVEDRGPYELAGERELIARHGIDVLVSKNAGGEAAYPKLQAAREAGLPVVMVDRPTVAAPDRVFYRAPDVCDWLASLAGSS